MLSAGGILACLSCVASRFCRVRRTSSLAASPVCMARCDAHMSTFCMRASTASFAFWIKASCAQTISRVARLTTFLALFCFSSVAQEENRLINLKLGVLSGVFAGLVLLLPLAAYMMQPSAASSSSASVSVVSPSSSSSNTPSALSSPFVAHM